MRLPLGLRAAAGVPTGSFEPTDLTSLKAWYDASDTSTVTVSTGVSEWRDKSGNAYHVAQATSSLQPAYTSGSHLTFNSDYLVSTTTRYGLGANPNLLILSVLTPTTTSTSNGNVMQIGGPTSSTGVLRVNASTLNASNGQFAWRYNNGNEIYSPATSGQTYITSFYHPSGGNYASSGLFLDGTEVSASSSTNPTNTTTNTATYVYIGGGGGLTSGENYVGTISELIVLESVTTDDRQKVEGYLAHKWGLTANLPSDHPYKTVAPA